MLNPKPDDDALVTAAGCAGLEKLPKTGVAVAATEPNDAVDPNDGLLSVLDAEAVLLNGAAEPKIDVDD